MRTLNLQFTNSFHPNTFGGKAALIAKQYIENGNLFMGLTILKGLSFDVKLTNVKKVIFIESTINKAGLITPLLIVKCEEY